MKKTRQDILWFPNLTAVKQQMFKLYIREGTMMALLKH
jgi:hypothetical protein